MKSNPQREPTLRHERLDEEWFHLFNLASMAAQLRAEPAHEVNGHTGLTLLKNEHLSVVLEAARKGSHTGEHNVDGPSFVLVLEGSLRLECGDETRLAHAGEMVVVPHDRIRDLWADEDSTFLRVLSLDGAAT
ncbi:MAG: AraC family ligand binding domain-containing protein [Myxococcota bacterium]